MSGTPFQLVEKFGDANVEERTYDTYYGTLSNEQQEIVGLFHIARNVTKLMGVVKELKETGDELRRANKELETFSYSVSHDLMAPLRSIDGFSRILVQKYADELSDEPKRLLNIVRNSVAEMGNLIDSLLKFSRLSRLPLQKTETNMNLLVQEALSVLKSDCADRKINIVVHPLPEHEAIDPILVKQVFVNLIANAIKFTKNKNPAQIEISHDTTQAEPVYSIKDNGVGFDMTYVDKLFGVFKRLHSVEEFEGTGIGLATCHRIIRRHGGIIWADSIVGQGTTFYFTLQEKTPP